MPDTRDLSKTRLYVAVNSGGQIVAATKVVRIQLGPGGTTVVSEEDFLSGGLPLDVTFDAAGPAARPTRTRRRTAEGVGRRGGTVCGTVILWGQML